jgi:putative protease
MKFNTFVTSREDIQACAATPSLEEVLIEPRELGREGRISKEQAVELAAYAVESGLKAVLVWDILMTQGEFKAKCEVVASMNLDSFDAIRTQDPGAAVWVRERLPHKKLQWVVENSNHNLPGLKRWVRDLAPERLVLSTQLPEEKLIACCRELSTQCEILGAGKILLFYSKRHLLQSNFSSGEELADAKWIYADSMSEESASRPFPTIENEHGTFMYLNKDHFILDKLASLQAAGMHTVRIDMRDLREEGHAAAGIKELCEKVLAHDGAICESWPRPTSAPFFKRNRTDKQFARMKPQTRLLRDNSCLGEVVSVERGEAIAIYALQEFSAGNSRFKYISHDGQTVEASIESFIDMSGNPVDSCQAQAVVVSPWVKGVKPGAILVRSE